MHSPDSICCRSEFGKGGIQEQSNDISFLRCDLLADNHIDINKGAVRSCAVYKGALNRVVIRDCDHLEIGVTVNVLDKFFWVELPSLYVE